MLDRFNQEINVGDVVIFSTSGEMDEGVVHKVPDRGNIITVKNSSGYNKKKSSNHCINKTRLLVDTPHLFL